MGFEDYLVSEITKGADFVKDSEAMKLVLAYGVWVLRRLSVNIASLNEKMAVFVVQSEVKAKAISDHEIRLRAVERALSEVKD